MKRRSKEDQYPAPTRMNPSLGAARRLMPPGILGAVLPWLIAQAQVDAPPTSSTLGAPPSRLIPDSATNLPVRDLGNGRWQLGQVLIDRSQRTVSFPAVVNMNSNTKPTPNMNTVAATIAQRRRTALTVFEGPNTDSDALFKPSVLMILTDSPHCLVWTRWFLEQR